MCQSNYFKIAFKGTANPNYKSKAWTKEKRSEQSKRTSLQMTTERRKEIGNQHRGKIISDETKQKMSDAHIGIKNPPISDETRIKIGLASSAKFTEEYKLNIRTTMEQLGHWIPLNEKDDYSLYFEYSNWIDKMFDYVINHEQLQLLNIKGVFHNINNKNGVVRDHIYSRREGFKNGVFPEIMRHPCNMQIITLGENTSKSRSNNTKNDCQQTLEELIYKIINFKQQWKEQQTVLSLIKKYNIGERYNKENYFNKIN